MRDTFGRRCYYRKRSRKQTKMAVKCAAPRRFKSVMTGCRCNYDGLKLIRFGALNDRARLGDSLPRSLARSLNRVSVVINGDNYNESADYSDYPVARGGILSIRYARL